ncbi:hypothetical protein BGW80DRAFT_1372378 [Lactifluus volemus]|nr:hypothetical protein BGW80DRAFT_1372378 [Lactifluus volemus]
MAWMKQVTSLTLHANNARAVCATSRFVSLVENRLRGVRFIGHAASTPALFENSNDVSPSLATRHPSFSGSTARKSLSTRTQRFDRVFDVLSTALNQARSKKSSLQVRSSDWLYLFDLATNPEQLERASGQFSAFIECRRQFRDQHVTAFVRRCAELRCPQLALTVFSNRPAYRMDLTLPAARQLLYALHEEHKLSDVATLVALYPLYNLPALSSDPISSALLISACLREARASDPGSRYAWTMAATLLPHFEQLLTETPPIPIPIPIEKNRFQENCWMYHAMLSILESLTVLDQDTSRVTEWCEKSGYGLSSKIS